MRLLVILLLIGVGVWIGKEWTDARRRRINVGPRDARGQRVVPHHRALDSGSLEAHISGLRAAVSNGELTLDEAVDSVVRLSAGGISRAAARQRLL
jgi:hypothetical protein